MRIVNLLTTLAVLIGAAAALTWWNERRAEGLGRAIDGDTLVLEGERYRLKGIDAPEHAQICEKDGKPWRCGEAARLALARQLDSGPLFCRSSERDRYGRHLAVCAVGGADLNAYMVRSGAAFASGAYESEEKEARDARRGVWSASRADKPAEWRRTHPAPNAPSAPAPRLLP